MVRSGSEGARPLLRVALYGHDTQGLGHLRRNLCIAELLARSPLAPETLICSGLSQARSFTLPPGADLLTLPALHKDDDGSYRPRSLGSSLRDLVGLRSQILRAALTTYDPDILIVDKVALGAVGELEPALQALHSTGRCRIVLGLRDILDAPRTARREWQASATTESIRRYYDAVWVYGDRAVVDPVQDYRLPPDIAAMVSFSGYLAAGRHASPPDELTERIIASGPYALCLVGGGQDGAPLAEAFLQARLPEGVRGVVVTGPLMAADARARLQATARALPDRQVVTFVSEPSWLIRSATVVAAMAGYNTVCELLEADVPAVLVPRTHPRREQQVRAERLAAMGFASCLLPCDVSPASLGAALQQALEHRPPSTRVDISGVSQLPELIRALLTTARTKEHARAAV